jgi:hypothetical protein
MPAQDGIYGWEGKMKKYAVEFIGTFFLGPGNRMTALGRGCVKTQKAVLRKNFRGY